MLAVIVVCIFVAVVAGFTERLPMPWVAVYIMIMFAFFIVTAWHLLKVDTIFAVYYMVFYVYTVFTQITYVAFPDKLFVVSDGQYYGIEWFWPFYVFTFASFLGAFLVFIGFRCKSQRVRYFRLTDARPQALIGKTAFASGSDSQLIMI